MEHCCAQRMETVVGAETVTQCDIRFGAFHDTAWIDSRRARVGARVIVEGLGIGTVHATYTTKTLTEAAARARDHAHQRRASDA